MIRKEFREKKEDIFSDPNSSDEKKEFIENAIALFDNEDAIQMLDIPQLTALIRWVGHERPEAREMALTIEKEVNKKYILIEPK